MVQTDPGRWSLTDTTRSDRLRLTAALFEIAADVAFRLAGLQFLRAARP